MSPGTSAKPVSPGTLRGHGHAKGPHLHLAARTSTSGTPGSDLHRDSGDSGVTPGDSGVRSQLEESDARHRCDPNSAHGPDPNSARGHDRGSDLHPLYGSARGRCDPNQPNPLRGQGAGTPGSDLHRDSGHSGVTRVRLLQLRSDPGVTGPRSGGISPSSLWGSARWRCDPNQPNRTRNGSVTPTPPSGAH